ncbi:hypothetical protein [Mucilaginibacter lappiensis]|uniref:Uncharacterized protein n=1 Tax=Mucilaginibacter lappiensis TaxID=354630 RepID=A0A841JB04_9SPHI|nr:hypothetical protein [Mucilaginibacter lappiensis]MBB6128339.1 hypothetical protein [Mucilaginibacter lappiensis]
MAKANRIPVDNGAFSIKQSPKDSNSSHERLLPRDTSKVAKVYWSFGFKFFEQRDYFGFSTVGVSWFVSVMQRLKQASQMEYVGMTQVLEDGYRYHEISWDAKNIPLKRADFHWVNKNYLENEQEFPFCQFHISKGKGRVIGFWDENNVFQILLLDPLHNLQPSKFTSYELRECFPVKSEYDSLSHDIQKIIRDPCNIAGCKIFDKLSLLPSGMNNTNVIMGYLDDGFFSMYAEILKSKTMTEILEAGILSFV